MVSGSTRERILAAAVRLFAERGYAATSVADIQTACGLTGGSGALYKHFTSKSALLHEVVEVHLSAMRAGNATFRQGVPDALADAMEFLIDAVWTSMERDRDALRVILRDLVDFPDLLDRVWSELRRNVYDVFAAWVAEREDVHVADPEATAAVLVASLTYHPILHALIGHTPGDVDAARYRSAWVRQAVFTLEGHRSEAASGREPR